MASDLISRTALLEDMKRYFDAIYGDDGKLLYSDHICNGEDVEYLINFIKQQPTVEAVEVVHGEWIKPDSMLRSAKCSECNCWITRHTINENWFRFCPHCGAKMDGRNE